MISSKIEKALNAQVKIEASSSHLYLSMASWAEAEGYPGVASFLYRHAEEERMHMLKLVKYINERGRKAVIPALESPPGSFKSLLDLFQMLYQHEVYVSEQINKLVAFCLKEQDYTTHHFVQWYVSEQIEEEALARTILDKLRLIGSDKGGLYLFDRDLQSLSVEQDVTGKNQ